jgi:ABC-type Fe3+ transport system permease subunit
MKINYVKTTTYLGVGATTTFLTHVGTDVITNTYGNSINSLSEGVGAAILTVVGLLALGYIVVKAGNGVDFLVKKVEKFSGR